MKYFLRKFLGSKYLYYNTIFWKIIALIYPIVFKRKGTLLYAGVNLGESFQKIFFKYEKVYGFEPNPENFKKLNYFQKFKNVKIYNLALSDKEGETNFFLPDNSNNVSATLAGFSEVSEFKTNRIIKVKTINLLNFLVQNNINYIDFYISDIEGYDFKVLSTIKSYIDSKKIKLIQVEALNNEVENHYQNTVNFERDFDDLLKKNYTKLGRGSGFVKIGDDFSASSLDILYMAKV